MAQSAQVNGVAGATVRRAVIIEDDIDIANLLEAVLQQAGFETFAAADGATGIELIRAHQPVLTTLDINLPGIDGFEVARQVRRFSSTYIIMLSARSEEIDTLMGLDSGADDYLTKPLRPRELRARVEAMLRRTRNAESPVLTAAPAGDQAAEDGWFEHNGLRVEPDMRLVELDGDALELTRTEFDLLVAILLRRRRVISKGELAEEIRPDLNGFVTDADRRSVETHLANLRRKLGDSVSHPRFIETVRGVGYRATQPTR